MWAQVPANDRLATSALLADSTPAANEELGGVRRPSSTDGSLLQPEEANGIIYGRADHLEEEDCAILAGCC